MVRFGAQCASFFVVLLDARVLVIDVQRGNHAVGYHPGAELAGCPAVDPTIEDQLHLARPSDIQILADDFLEEDSPADGAVQHLGQRELDLQH